MEKYTSSIAPTGGKPAGGDTTSSVTRRYSLDSFPLRSLGIFSKAEFKICIHQELRIIHMKVHAKVYQ